MDSGRPMDPRQLYTVLCECADARARASATLDFLLASAGAQAGFVLLKRGGELLVAASSNQQELPAPLMERAQNLWVNESEYHGGRGPTRTLDASQIGAALVESSHWQGPNGERYEPRVLGIYKSSRWLPVGIALLASEGKCQPIRHAHIDAMCNALLDSGDVSADE